MESAKCKTSLSVVQAEYQKALQSEVKEKQLLSQLMKAKFYSNKTILDDLIEKSKKRLNEIKIHVEELENVLGCTQNKETAETEGVSLKNEDTKSGNIILQDDNFPENKVATSVNDLPNEIINIEYKERKHPEIEKENFDEVAGTITSCFETPQNVNDGDDEQKSDEISCSQITVLSEQQVPSGIEIDQPDEGNINKQMSTSKEATLDKLSGLPPLKEPHYEDVKTVLLSDVECVATPDAGNSNAGTKISVMLIDAGTKERVEKLEKNNLSQVDIATGENTVPTTTSDVALQLNSDDKLKTINVRNAIQNTKQVEVTISKATHINANIVKLDKQIVKNGSTEVEVLNEGCSLSSSELTCSVRQNTDDVPSSKAETTSTQVSSAGSPPGCDEPRFGCVDIESVVLAEQVLANSHPSTSSDKQSDEDCVKDKSPVGVTQDDVNIAGKKEFTENENKVENDETIATGSKVLSKKNDDQRSDKSKTTKKEENNGKKNKNKVKKDKNKLKKVNNNEKRDKNKVKKDNNKEKKDKNKEKKDKNKEKKDKNKEKKDKNKEKKDKNKEKKTKMAKVENKEKRSKDEKMRAAEKMKSKQFHHRLGSLFCF